MPIKLLHFLILLHYLDVFYGQETDTCAFPKGLIRRVFYVDGKETSIGIEVTRRTSHQLVSHIAKILLQEVLGYKNVKIINQDDNGVQSTLQKMSNCQSPEECNTVEVTVPELMINLETWLPPGFNLAEWVNTKRIEDCGPLGPIGRSGWFVEKKVVDYFWNSNNTVIDHYKAFLNPEVAKSFDLSTHFYVVQKANETCNDDLYECRPDGFYRPEHCRKEHVSCATLLADFPNTTYHFLKEIIQKYKLLVSVAWLGEHFEDALFKLTSEPTKTNYEGNIMFYYKTPMMLSSTSNISIIKFPECEGQGDIKCSFEVNPLQKIVWSEIKNSAQYVYGAIRAMTFSQEEYKALLKEYYHSLTRGWKYYNMACEWLKENQIKWEKWIPEDAQKKTNLYIGGIFPFSGVYWTTGRVAIAAQMAAEAINTNHSILAEYELNIVKQDGACKTEAVTERFIQYVREYDNMVGILGPACSDTVESIAVLATYFNMMIISYSAEGTLSKGQENYPYFFRTIPENNLYKYVYLKLFENLRYSKVATLIQEEEKNPEYLSNLHRLMQDHGMELHNCKKLEEVKSKNARIIIADFPDYAARSIMCNAYKLGMTASNGYLWFLPYWYPANWYDTNEFNRNFTSAKRISCSTEQMIEAIDGYFSLSYKYYADDNSMMQENVTVKQWKNSYREKAKENGEVYYAGYAYDAVWVYALALDKLIKENESHVSTLHSVRTSRRFAEIIRNTSFTGVTGHLHFQNSSRVSDVSILQWRNGSFHQVGLYKAESLEDGKLDFNEKNVKWLTSNGQKPSDGSNKGGEHCAVEVIRALFNTQCHTAVVIVNLIGIFFFTVFAIIAMYYFYQQRLKKQMRLQQNRMKELGLFANGMPFALDKWELPRESIVINKLLGEGAFGTVYGGTAFVKTEGYEGWTAVAVKTLKKNAKPEEKLDFLCEAEIMKKFDHINIVKLVGVCTSGEPVYTIMEFMLYGDLKTYLEDRRNMACEKDRCKTGEVSDSRLTHMAIDIARGLSYLADKKFVHRDLACRNCLVSASRSVKIGDFGMCRAMYDSEYYKYNKKGIMPIRWMAPESIVHGVFTPMSDVWSYGVVLYEIITFGGPPYKGFTHEQVLAHVKSFKTLPVPKGCKPELEKLLRRCWDSNPKNRPQAAEIVEILAQNPELITPCLDVPSTSTALEELNCATLKAQERTRNSFSSVLHTRKTSCPDTSQFGFFGSIQAGQEMASSTKHSGIRYPIKKTCHSSFKKARKDFLRNKALDGYNQITHL